MIPEKRNRLTLVLLIVYLLLLTGVILFKLPFYSEHFSDGIRVISLIPFQGSFDRTGGFLWHEIIDNILLFVPLGIYISLLNRQGSSGKKVLPVIGLSFAYEIIQFIFALGRSDVTDLLGNTLGGIIGIGIYAISFKILKSKTLKVANTLALIITICVVVRFGQLFYLSHFVMGAPR